MTLSFSRKIGNWPTEFPEKIIEGLEKSQLISKDQSAQFRSDLFNKHPLKTDLPFIIGCKLHTIRLDPKNRWKVGTKIHFVINNRQKNRYQFAPVFEVKHIYDITINPNTRRIFLNSKELDPDTQNDLINNDGFYGCHNAFWSYFNELFTGKLIQWVDVNDGVFIRNDYLNLTGSNEPSQSK